MGSSSVTSGNGPLIGRRALLGLAVAGTAAALAGCAPPYADARLVIATGGPTGVYIQLGRSLARVWRDRLRLAAEPDVRLTAGSVQNLTMLAWQQADVVISQVDTATDSFERDPSGPRSPRALARIYDDVLHVVVRQESPIRTISDLRGRRVSIGAADSGVAVIADRVLQAAGLSTGDLDGVGLGLGDSVAAMQRGELDAFFWSGGLPTPNVTQLAATMRIRLLDLDEDGTLARVRELYPVYAPGTVPASSYGVSEPIVTMLVRNFLLVPAEMDEGLAYQLIEAVFVEQPELALTVRAALRIDSRAAIGTQPVPLHPGAQRFYQDEKD